MSRTTWRAKPCGWRDRERVVALGEEFQSAGPLVLDLLEELAKEQRSDGEVRTGLRSIARGAFLARGSDGVELARTILGFAQQVGAIDDLVLGDDAGMTVTCRVSGFVGDQGRGYEAVRKGQQRADRDEPGPCPDDRDSVPVGPGDGDAVTVCPPTGQDRTEQETSSLRSDGARDEIPDDVAEDLRPAIEHVHGRLGALAAAKGVDAPTLRRVAQVIVDFPDHDHRRVVGDVVDYWQHGDGKTARRKDFARVYRERCGRVPASAQIRGGRHLQSVPEARTSGDAFIRRQQERKDREEATARRYEQEPPA